MAITFPRDLPADPAFQAHTFQLRYQQSYALTGGGSPQAADIGPPVWEARYQIDTTSRIKTGEWEAWLASLRGGLRTFKGWPPGHRWPMAHPRGFAGLTVSGSPFDGTGNVSAIGAQWDTITINQVPNGFTLQPGDYLSIPVAGRQHLHRVTEGAVASGNALTVSVEPTIRPNATTGVEVRFEYPYCEMVLISPPTVSGSLHKYASVSFQGVQVLV